MKRPLPSANRRVSETSRNLTRGSMNLGVGAFNKMFPTLGRFVSRIDGGKPQQEKTDTVSRRTRASVDIGLSRSNDNLGTILNNQNIQNQLLERLLSSFKAMPSNQPSSGLLSGSMGDLLSNLLTGLGLLSLVPAIRRLITPTPKPPTPSARPPAAAPRPSTPAARPPVPAAAPPAARPPATAPAARALSTISSAAGAGLRVLSRFAGPLGLAYTLYDGLQQLSSELTNSLAGPRLTFTRILQSLGENIEVLRNLEQQLRDEQDEQKAAELGVDIERQLRIIESQRGRILEIAILLDRAESRRRNTTNRVSFTQTVQRLLGESSSFIPQQTSTVAPPPSVPSVPPPPSIPAIPAAPPSVPPVPAPVAEAATRVEGSSVIYDFEKILFEADLIKFDGPFNLQAPAAAVSLPSMSSGSTSGATNVVAGNIFSGGSGSGVTATQISSSGSSSGSASTGSNGDAPAATRVGGSSVSSTPAQITGTTAQILATIRQKESGSNYQAQSRASTASGAYQFIDGTWRSLTRQFNIGTEYNRAVEAPPAVQDAVAAAYVNQILSRNNGDVSVVPLVWYTGNARGAMSAAALATNRGLTPQEYQRQWMQSFASMGGTIPTGAVSTQVAAAPSTGPALAQASTARVATDRQQTSANIRMVSEMERQALQRNQQGAPASVHVHVGSQRAGGEVPLKIRILSTFDQLARA